MKKILNIFLMFGMIGFFAASCSDDNNTVSGANDQLIDTTGVFNLETFFPDRGDTIKYYSLRENKVIPEEQANTTNWDIGFLRTTIFVNSGVKGPGQGGAFVLRNVIFNDVKEVPADSVFKTEDSPTARAITTGSGKGWYNYDGAKFEITPLPGVVLIIRTADGKGYAKVKILSYYKGYPDNIPADVTQRTDKAYSFMFALQTNGTKSFLK